MSNSLNDNLKTNIRILCDCKKTNKTKLSVYTEISESCIDRATANVPLGLSYENLTKLSLFSYLSMDELLLPYTKLMEAIIDTPGRYRDCGVGVFSEQGLVHMAPPADRVPQLMRDLFDWLKHIKDHLLIRSCVFHYEFEFIHPFADGNGRMGRLWQSLILGKLHPLFEHLPVENMVFSNQQAYYDAIAISSQTADSGAFIDFMLGEILDTLKKHQGEELNLVPNIIPNKVPNKLRTLYPDITESAWDVLAFLKKNPDASALMISGALEISDRMVRKHISVLKDAGIIKRIGSNKTGHWEVINEAKKK